MYPNSKVLFSPIARNYSVNAGSGLLVGILPADNRVCRVRLGE